DGLAVVVHAEGDSAALGELGDLHLDGLAAVLRGVGDGDRAGAGHLEVGGLVLVAVGVAADDDRLGPAGDQPRHVGADDRLAEDHAAEDVADGAVGRPPHLLETELLDPGLVGGDGRALDTDAVLLDGVGRVDRHLVVGAVALLDAQVVVLEVDVEVRQDQPFLDEGPDDPGHLVAVELHYGILNLDLGHGSWLSLRVACGRTAGTTPRRGVPARGSLIAAGA